MSILLRLREYEVRTVIEGEGNTIVEVRTKEGGLVVPLVVRRTCVAMVRAE